jgi:transposase
MTLTLRGPIDFNHLTMSTTELDRLQVLQKIMESRMTQAAAANMLGLSYRQVKRLMARFRRQGVAGLVSQKRGKQDQLAPLHRALFLEPNPAGRQFAL